GRNRSKIGRAERKVDQDDPAFLGETARERDGGERGSDLAGGAYDRNAAASFAKSAQLPGQRLDRLDRHDQRLYRGGWLRLRNEIADIPWWRRSRNNGSRFCGRKSWRKSWRSTWYNTWRRDECGACRRPRGGDGCDPCRYRHRMQKLTGQDETTGQSEHGERRHQHSRQFLRPSRRIR